MQSWSSNMSVTGFLWGEIKSVGAGRFTSQEWREIRCRGGRGWSEVGAAYGEAPGVSTCIPVILREKYKGDRVMGSGQ